VADLRRVVAPPLPAPAEKYDRENEAAFRESADRTLRALVEVVRDLAARVEALEG
jgi:hypothetical protein